jgi:hypothetical protein
MTGIIDVLNTAIEHQDKDLLKTDQAAARKAKRVLVLEPRSLAAVQNIASAVSIKTN